MESGFYLILIPKVDRRKISTEVDSIWQIILIDLNNKLNHPQE